MGRIKLGPSLEFNVKYLNIKLHIYHFNDIVALDITASFRYGQPHLKLAVDGPWICSSWKLEFRNRGTAPEAIANAGDGRRVNDNDRGQDGA